MTGWPEGEALKINLFLDTHIRLSEVTKMMDEIEKEKAELEHLTGKPVSIDEFNILKKDFHWHKLTRNSESGNMVMSSIRKEWTRPCSVPASSRL